MNIRVLLFPCYDMCEDDSRLTPMKLRKKLGLTQVQMAQRLNKSPSTVFKWESRSVVPTGTPSEIKSLCLAYECSLDELIEAFESPIQNENSPGDAENIPRAVTKGGDTPFID